MALRPEKNRYKIGKYRVSEAKNGHLNGSLIKYTCRFFGRVFCLFSVEDDPIH